ncbi:metal-binding protein [Methylorubrum populi]|uniref:Metal-binding protein n=1 Tax=Methylobacterium radiotolerans TaxID=31998 RepID=A0ABU7TCX1_9HYPH
MTLRSESPLSRSVNVERLPKDRAEIVVEASPAECEALARDFKIPALRDLVGRFTLSGSLTRLRAEGRVEAVVTQVCTVTLEPFESKVSEPVEVEFTNADILEGTEAEDVELPDPIVNGRVDFGALTAEFLALGLDPYPRKPGVAFDPVTVGEDPLPFSDLAALRARLEPKED